MKLLPLLLLAGLFLLHSAVALEEDSSEPSSSSIGQRLAAGWSRFMKGWDPDSSSWECGTNKIALTEQLASIFTKATCPSLYSSVNLACKAHDACYDHPNMTRNSCDDAFCQQLKALPLDREEHCNVHETFCFMVKNFSSLVYKKKTSAGTEEDALPF